MNTNCKLFLLMASIGILFYSAPSAHAIAFDEQTCMSLLSADQVKNTTGFEKTINVKTINADMTGLNDDLKSGCMISLSTKTIYNLR